jgi:hypothetical protein
LSTYGEQLRGFDRQIIDSGYFQGLFYDQMEYEITYRIEDYLLLLTTLSPYLQLPGEQRERLLAGLRETLIKNCPNGVPLTHLAAIQMASKI